MHIIACAITVGTTLASYCPWVSCCELNERSSTFFQLFLFPSPLFVSYFTVMWGGGGNKISLAKSNSVVTIVIYSVVKHF